MPSRPTPPIAEFRVSGSDAGPYGITCGPDGALWFTMVHDGRIGLAHSGRRRHLLPGRPSCQRAVDHHNGP